MAETNDELLARWRRTRSEIDGYDGQVLDPVDRQTLSDLKRHLAHAEAELARRGLSIRPEARVGAWQPLPLHEAPAPERAPTTAEFTWERRAEAEPDWFLYRAALLLDAPEAGEPEWIFAQRPELRGEWQREHTQAVLDRPAQPILVHQRLPPFVPDLCDGLTSDQRGLIERIALGPCTEADLVSTSHADRGAASHALEQLRLPRPHPLTEVRGDVLTLTALAREMVAVGHGHARVHGGLFPNLLVNGACDELAFPVRDLFDVLATTRLLVAAPDVSPSSLEAAAPIRRELDGCGRLDFVERSTTSLGVLVLPLWAPGRLEFEFLHLQDAERANEGLAMAEARGELAAGTSHSLSGLRLLVSLPPGSFGLAVVRRLARDGALESTWSIQSVVTDGTEARNRTLTELFDAFVSRTRRVVGRRLRRQFTAREPRLEVLEGLLRIADDQRLASLVDAAESRAEAIWALTHLGTRELAVHPRLGRFALDAEAFSETQARAIVETNGLHQKRRFLELEHEALLEGHRNRAGWVTRQMVDDQVLKELDRIAALARATARR